MSIFWVQQQNVIVEKHQLRHLRMGCTESSLMFELESAHVSIELEVLDSGRADLFSSIGAGLETMLYIL